MAVLKRASGIDYQFGGEPHTGWLPAGAATPLPAPIRHVTLDVTIEDDGGTGFLLIVVAREEPKFTQDDWFPTMASAEAAAETRFGIEPGDWKLA